MLAVMQHFGDLFLFQFMKDTPQFFTQPCTYKMDRDCISQLRMQYRMLMIISYKHCFILKCQNIILGISKKRNLWERNKEPGPGYPVYIQPIQYVEFIPFIQATMNVFIQGCYQSTSVQYFRIVVCVCVLCGSYEETCYLQLFENDIHWDQTLDGAVISSQAHQIRTLFSILICTYLPS